MKAFRGTRSGLYALLLISAVFAGAATANAAYAESQTASTDGGTLDVRVQYDPIYSNTDSKINVEFLNPFTKKTQVHIDYMITIERDGESVFGPTSLIHTSPGVISVPIQFQSVGTYSVIFSIQGILFQPIPPELVSFDIPVSALPEWIKTNAGWWADGAIDDATFVAALEYLIQNKIIAVPTDDTADANAGNGSNNPSQIPSWVKTNAGWWADGAIDDATFVAALQYLIINGIIQV